jgi:hypothetical protein
MVDLVRLEDGNLVENWDVVHDKAARETSKTGLLTFGDNSPTRHSFLSRKDPKKAHSEPVSDYP